MDSNRRQIDEIKDRLDIVQVVEKYVKLKKAGKNYSGLCPFHTEKTPSFIVSPDIQRYKCFGCGESGDIFNFIQEIENLDFPETLEKLAKEAGVELEKKEINYKYKILEEINYNAAKYFYNELKKDKNALQYLLDRGFTKEILKAFGVGYAPKKAGLKKYLLAIKKYSQKDLVSSGLFNLKDGVVKEKFYDRIMFPIRSKRGKVIAFTGRVLPGNDWGPKYMNSPDTPIFHKKENLFGQYESRQEIRKNDLAIICEGSTDVISAHQHEIKNIVAPLGTGLTEEQLGNLSSLTKNVLFIFDSDKAGFDALIRGFKIASQLKLNPYAASTEPCKDLDEFLQKDCYNIVTLIDNKKEAFSHIISHFMSEKNTNRLEDLNSIINFIGPLLEAVKDSTTRQLYISKVEKMLKIQLNNKTIEQKDSKTNYYKRHMNTLADRNYYESYIKYLFFLDSLKNTDLLDKKYIEPITLSKLYSVIIDNKKLSRKDLYEEIRKDQELLEVFENIVFSLSDIPETQKDIEDKLKILSAKIKADYYKKKQKELSVKIAIAEENNDNEKSEKYLKELMKINNLLKENND
jgi:DNA primase